jgi:hypothetical protein
MPQRHLFEVAGPEASCDNALLLQAHREPP